MFDIIKELCAIDGISGREHAVADKIEKLIKPYATTITKDNLGNIIAFKEGKKTPKNKVMISAHMDEVGLIITDICEDGTLKFSRVGGINPKVIIGRRVRIGEIFGVIGAKPIHKLKEDERCAAPDADSLSIDIGALSKSEAEAVVSLGDMAAFCCEYEDLGNESIVAKALDDRIGCAAMIDIMKQGILYDTYFTFVVQEEVGLRGAKVASYTVNPDIAIILETTASGDVAGVEGANRVAVVGGGAVVSYMDRSTIYDKGLYDMAFSVAKENSIPCQTKTKVAGGNDAGAIHVSRGGVRVAAISVPSKYIHSPSSVVNKQDVLAVRNLAAALANEAANK